MRAAGIPMPKQLWVPKGCEHCGTLGYTGRTGLFELWHLSEADYELILNHVDEHSLREHFHRSQPETLLLDGISKVEAGLTSLSEIRKAASGAFPSISLEKITRRNGRAFSKRGKNISAKNHV